MTAAQAAAADDDVPTLEPTTATNNTVAEEEMAARGGKQTKRYAKAMAKLGLKPEAEIVKVVIKSAQSFSFAIVKPEAYRFPGTNTFVIFGEAQMEESGADAQKKAAAAFAAASAQAEAAATAAPAAAAAAAPAAAAAAAADDEDEDAGTLQDKEINVVMSQAHVTRGRAIKALKENNGDIVNAIMALTM